MKIIDVAGGDLTPYQVWIGEGLIDAAQDIERFAPRRRATVTVDARLKDSLAPRLIAGLAAKGLETRQVEVPSGEASKSWNGLQTLTEAWLDMDLDRKDVVVALGGGVTGDLVGFAAAIYKRGIDFIQVPTTLLAQVDSSVGGKTAIDTRHGKNLVGAFWQPRLVLCDLGALDTLPDRQMRAGYAEVVKYGLLGDAAFFAWLEDHGAAVLARERAPLAQAVAHSVQMKADIVGRDEREAGERALLNLGHTFGHALEAELGFDDVLLHGEAVAVGTAQAFRFSARQGLCPAADAVRTEAALIAAGLPTRLGDIQNAPFAVDRLIAHMRQDKKASGGDLTLVLARGIGQAFTQKGVDEAQLRAFLRDEGAAA